MQPSVQPFIVEILSGADIATQISRFTTYCLFLGRDFYDGISGARGQHRALKNLVRELAPTDISNIVFGESLNSFRINSPGLKSILELTLPPASYLQWFDTLSRDRKISLIQWLLQHDGYTPYLITSLRHRGVINELCSLHSIWTEEDYLKLIAAIAMRDCHLIKEHYHTVEHLCELYYILCRYGSAGIVQKLFDKIEQTLEQASNANALTFPLIINIRRHCPGTSISAIIENICFEQSLKIIEKKGFYLRTSNPSDNSADAAAPTLRK